MGNVNTELGSNIRGRKVVKRTDLRAWEVCNAEQFINYWLPLFESGQLHPEQAPIAAFLHMHEENEHDLSA